MQTEDETKYIYLSMAVQSFLLDLGRFFSFLILYTVGRTPWTGDQPVARPLPTHRTTQIEQTHRDIHAFSGIRNHDPSVRASEESSCLRKRGHCDRPKIDIELFIMHSCLHLVKKAYNL
jgi:hypothetical protein